MATKDSTIPSGFSVSKKTTVTVPKNGANSQRIDNGVAISSNLAQVFTATNGMGKVIFFDLGDADTTSAEVVWVIKSVKNNPSLFGLPTNMPFYSAVGPFSDSKYKYCAMYAHADYRAVHVACIIQISAIRAIQQLPHVRATLMCIARKKLQTKCGRMPGRLILQALPDMASLNDTMVGSMRDLKAGRLQSATRSKAYTHLCNVNHFGKSTKNITLQFTIPS